MEKGSHLATIFTVITTGTKVKKKNYSFSFFHPKTPWKNNRTFNNEQDQHSTKIVTERKKDRAHRKSSHEPPYKPLQNYS